MRPGPAAARTSLLAVLTGLFLVFPFRLSAPDAQTQPVDVAIVLAVDCSWSVDDLEYKQQMEVLVDYLGRALRERIETLDWMDEETRIQALDKFEKFTPIVMGTPC